MKRKIDFDKAVAIQLRRSQADVSRITRAFIDELMRALIEDRFAHIDGFGKFRMTLTRKGKRQKIPNEKCKATVQVREKRIIHFSKAVPFRRAIIDAYGPAEDNHE